MVSDLTLRSLIHFEFIFVHHVRKCSNFCFCFLFLAAPHGMWDLSSPTRDRTCATCIGSTGS